MSKILKCNKLLEITEAEKQDVCAEFGITVDDYWELRKKAVEFIDQSEHLPKDYETALLAGCVFNNKGNFEAAKRFIDNFYRVKNQYAEPLFDHCIPGTEMYTRSTQLTYNVCTRKLLPAPFCYRVQIYKLNDPEGKAVDSFDYMVMLCMMCELRGAYDFWASTVVIFDMEHLTIKNLLKYTSQWVFATKDIFESVHLRVQGFHFVNGPPVLEKMLVILRAVLPAKMKERIMVHKDIKSLQEVVPLECLPKDYGGYDDFIEDLQKEWLDAMDELKPFYERCRAAKSTKKYEFDDNQRENMGLGVDGTFKKLSID